MSHLLRTTFPRLDFSVNLFYFLLLLLFFLLLSFRHINLLLNLSHFFFEFGFLNLSLCDLLSMFFFGLLDVIKELLLLLLESLIRFFQS